MRCCDECHDAAAVEERLQMLCQKIGHEWDGKAPERCSICGLRRPPEEAS